MKRRDYVLLAGAIKRAREFSIDADLPGVDWVIENIAQELARDNPRFDRELFLTNCGVNGT